MEEEYVMIETFRDAQPDDGDSATVSSLSLASLDQADEEAKKLAMLLWALKVHRGELRMFGGVWRRVPEFSPPLPDWAQPKPGALSAKVPGIGETDSPKFLRLGHGGALPLHRPGGGRTEARGHSATTGVHSVHLVGSRHRQR